MEASASVAIPYSTQGTYVHNQDSSNESRQAVIGPNSDPQLCAPIVVIKGSEPDQTWVAVPATT